MSGIQLHSKTRGQCSQRFNVGSLLTLGIVRLLMTGVLPALAAIGSMADITAGDVVYALPSGWESGTTNGENVQVMPSAAGGSLIVFLSKTLATDDPAESLRGYWGANGHWNARAITPVTSEKTPFGTYNWSAAYITLRAGVELYCVKGATTLSPSRWNEITILTDRPETLTRYQYDVLALMRSARLSEPGRGASAGRSSDESVTKQLIGRWNGIGFYDVGGHSASVGDYTFNSDGSFHQSYDHQGGNTQAIFFFKGRYRVTDGYLLLQPEEAHYTMNVLGIPLGGRRPLDLALRSVRIVQFNRSAMKLEIIPPNKRSVIVDYRKELEN